MITSRQNTLIKEIKSLENKKFRDKLNLFTVEGIKSVKEAMSSGYTVKTLLLTESGKALFGETSVKTETVTDGVFSYVSGEVSPQGVLAVCVKPENVIKSPVGNCVLLDEVKDPSNVGAIIRTAAAAGYKDVYLKDSADPFNGKAVRASMGGLFKVNVHIGGEELLEVISNPLIVADLGGENVFKFKSDGNFCLVIGNEGHGVSEILKKLSRYTVKIPMQNGMESLNAAVSAGIIMYALNEDIKGE